MIYAMYGQYVQLAVQYNWIYSHDYTQFYLLKAIPQKQSGLLHQSWQSDDTYMIYHFSTNGLPPPTYLLLYCGANLWKAHQWRPQGLLHREVNIVRCRHKMDSHIEGISVGVGLLAMTIKPLKTSMRSYYLYNFFAYAFRFIVASGITYNLVNSVAEGRFVARN
jgi:hypothetical protein